MLHLGGECGGVTEVPVAAWVDADVFVGSGSSGPPSVFLCMCSPPPPFLERRFSPREGWMETAERRSKTGSKEEAFCWLVEAAEEEEEEESSKNCCCGVDDLCWLLLGILWLDNPSSLWLCMQRALELSWICLFISTTFSKHLRKVSDSRRIFLLSLLLLPLSRPRLPPLTTAQVLGEEETGAEAVAFLLPCQRFRRRHRPCLLLLLRPPRFLFLRSLRLLPSDPSRPLLSPLLYPILRLSLLSIPYPRRWMTQLYFLHPRLSCASQQPRIFLPSMPRTRGGPCVLSIVQGVCQGARSLTRTTEMGRARHQICRLCSPKQPATQTFFVTREVEMSGTGLLHPALQVGSVHRKTRNPDPDSEGLGGGASRNLGGAGNSFAVSGWSQVGSGRRKSGGCE